MIFHLSNYKLKCFISLEKREEVVISFSNYFLNLYFLHLSKFQFHIHQGRSLKLVQLINYIIRDIIKEWVLALRMGFLLKVNLF